MKVAVIGAEGCLGTRIVESFQLGGGPPVAALTDHSFHAACATRFALDLRVADVLDSDALQRGFAGCSAAVHAMPVDPSGRKRSATAFCRAAARAGLRRLVYVSHADVHGLSPPAGTDEESPLHSRHASAEVNAFVAAERQFCAESRELGLEGIVLRPGLIYGPRSEFAEQVADDLQQDRAHVLDQGAGICNCIYVDNLVAAVRLALKTRFVAGSAYLVTDEETVTWRQFYEAVAHEFGLSAHAIQYGADHLGAAAAPVGPRSLPLSDALARHLCRWKLSGTHARKHLGLQELVPFAEGIRRTAAWWHFAHGEFAPVV
jgi:nucleoside-diphosphate-sugar epimerase